MKPISFMRHRFPADEIRHAVWLYLRFSPTGPMVWPHAAQLWTRWT
nr:hypothetical protein [Brevundimonas subvibrioides]